MRPEVIFGISPRFRGLSQRRGQVTHVLLTRSPLEYPRKGLSARLACVKHAASVRPEPGSNSPSRPNSPPVSTTSRPNPKENNPSKTRPSTDRCSCLKEIPTHEPENRSTSTETPPPTKQSAGAQKGTGF